MSFLQFETLKNGQKSEQEVNRKLHSLLCTAPLAANKDVVKKDNSAQKLKHV